MKILVSPASELFTDNRPHGEGLICYQIVSRLAKRGHHLHVFSSNYDLQTDLPNTEIVRINDRTRISSLRHWKYQLKSSAALQRIMQNGKVDVVHHLMPLYHETHFSSAKHAPLVLGPMFLPWQLTDEDLDVPQPDAGGAKRLAKEVLGRISRRMYSETLNRAEKILITVDNPLRELLPADVQPNVRIIPFGVDTKKFAPAQRQQNIRPTILFLANLLKRKGLRFLLEAMPLIKEEVPNVRLDVVGGGPGEQYFKTLADCLGVTSEVSFEGPVSHDETVKWFQQCDLYCLPSLGEPFGVSVLEAMACGKPVVVTDAGGIPSFVENGRGGYLVPLRDPASLAEAAIKILKNDSLAAQMGKHNRELCIRKYDWEIIVDQIESVYEEVVH